MNTFIALIFTILYILETFFLFFLANNTEKATPLIIAGLTSIVVIWASNYFIQKSSLTHPTLALLAIALILVIGIIFPIS